ASRLGVRSHVSYRPLNKNRFVYPGYTWNDHETLTDGDGRYVLPVLPGPGIVLVKTMANLDYQPAEVVDQHLADGAVVKASVLLEAIGPYLAEKRNAVHVLCPAATDRTATLQTAVHPGLSRLIKVVDPDGKPLPGVAAVGVRPGGEAL